jgi:hypothetical protein
MKSTTILGLGFLAFVLLSLVAIVLGGSWVEDDLAERTEQRLEAAGIVGVGIDVNGRHVVLSSSGADDDALKLAQETVEDVWGVRSVSLETN